MNIGKDRIKRFVLAGARDTAIRFLVNHAEQSGLRNRFNAMVAHGDLWHANAFTYGGSKGWSTM